MSQSEHHRERVRSAVARTAREIVARREISLAALSRDTGIPRSTLRNKLLGNRDFTVAELVRLALALEVPAADLIAGTESPPLDDGE